MEALARRRVSATKGGVPCPHRGGAGRVGLMGLRPTPSGPAERLHHHPGPVGRIAHMGAERGKQFAPDTGLVG